MGANLNPCQPNTRPACKEIFELASWQPDDGPCADGLYYCVACISENRCGCVGSIDNRQDADTVQLTGCQGP